MMLSLCKIQWFNVTYRSLTLVSAAPRQFFRLSIFDTNTPSAPWLEQYFATTTGIDPLADPDGDGINTWQEFLAGTSPTDYFNGHLPHLRIVSGGNQWGPPDGILPEPVAVAVQQSQTGSAMLNAPVTFSSTSALLSADGMGNWSSSLTLRTSAHASGIAARVHVKLPASSSTVSRITASVSSAGQTRQIETTAGTFDVALQAPTGLKVSVLSATSLKVEWTPSDETYPTSIEISKDQGATWQLWDVVAPGVRSVDVEDLETGRRVEFRVITGDVRTVQSAALYRPNLLLEETGWLISLRDRVMEQFYGKTMKISSSPRVSPPSEPVGNTPAETSSEPPGDLDERFVLFSSVRKKSLTFTGSHLPNLPEPEREAVYSAPIYRRALSPEELPEPAPTDDGFNGDADLEGNNVDPHDPRDLFPPTEHEQYDYSEQPLPGYEYSGEWREYYFSRQRRHDGMKSRSIYLARNAYRMPYQQKVENHIEDQMAFNFQTAMGLLGQVGYEKNQDPSHEGWQGNGGLGVGSVEALTSYARGESEITYEYYPEGLNWEVLTETVSTEWIAAAMESCEVRLECNMDRTEETGPVQATFLVCETIKPVSPQQGEGNNQPTTTIHGVITLRIVEGKVSTEHEVSGQLPDELTIQGGVVAIAPPAPQEGCRVSLGLVPGELAVDADRNGTMEFGKDTTSPEKPFRFWTNDDSDSGSETEDLSGTPNREDSQINGVRDLEDFTLIKFKLPEFVSDMIKEGDAKVGFRWSSVAEGNPSVKLWSGRPELATAEDYLSNHEEGIGVVQNNNLKQGSGRVVDSGTAVWLRDDLYDDTPSSGEVSLLFEGYARGKGKLALVFQINGQQCDGPAVDMHLMHVQEMFERARAYYPPTNRSDPDGVPHPWVEPSPSPMSWHMLTDHAFVKDPQETEECIAYVHGWRMDVAESTNWQEMSFKRLWQAGFKGRFAVFQWPTYSGENNGAQPADLYLPGAATYNPSEYRAWLSGPALAGFVNQLPYADKRYIFAHSMGNVVTGAPYAQECL